MPDLTDAILFAATLQPAQWTSKLLAAELDLDQGDIDQAIVDLRNRGMIQKRRGSPKWGGADRIRATKAGDSACVDTLRAQLMDGAGPD
ncbi:MAG: hypothetical protein GXP62_15590 [Oligoflexia bacterium]|nr:hypothetical protein [Oligoflexia bacterium]